MNDSVDALPRGAQLGQYHLIEAASQGGFGILYRAWDEKLNRPVAVKECFPASICRRDPQTGVLRPHSEALQAQYDAAINDAFEEVQTLAKLHHARVVPVYDVFRSAGSLFYVMPWLEGGSLRDRIAAGDAISPETAQNWLLELLSALEYLHGMQVIHRDIKPGNIMFDVEGNPVLVDFGSALNRATKVDTTTQGEFSPVYASPEQVSGKGKIGPWTDLYSLAATWYELLAGMQPEPAQQRLVQDDLQPLPPGRTVLEQSIMQNLALVGAARCQSAREWRDWLLLGAAPVAVARRRRSLLLWAVPAVLLAAGGAFLLGRQQAEPVRETPAQVAEPTLPAPEKLEVVLTDELYTQVCEQMGISAIVQQQDGLKKQFAEWQEEKRQEVQELYLVGEAAARTHPYRLRRGDRGFIPELWDNPCHVSVQKIRKLKEEGRSLSEKLVYQHRAQVLLPLEKTLQNIVHIYPADTPEEHLLQEKIVLRIMDDYVDILNADVFNAEYQKFASFCSVKLAALDEIWYARVEENYKKWEQEKAEADAAVLTDEMYHQIAEKRGFTQLLAERKAMDEQAQKIAGDGVCRMEEKLVSVRKTLDAIDVEAEKNPAEKVRWLGIDFHNEYREALYAIEKEYMDGQLMPLHQEYCKTLQPQLQLYRASSYQQPDDDEMSEMEKRMEALFLERAKSEYAQVIKTTPYLEPFKYFSKESERIEHEMHSLRQAKEDALWKREREMERERLRELQ